MKKTPIREGFMMFDHTDQRFIRHYQEIAAELPVPRLCRIERKPNRLVSGGIARTPGGRLWAAWLNHAESRYSYGVLAFSDDDGRSWSPPCFETDHRTTSGDSNRTTMTINLWTAPDGRLFCFYDSGLEIFDGESGIWQSVCEDPDSDAPVWSSPQRLWHGWAINKPIVLATNDDWLLTGSLLIYPTDPLRPCVCDHRHDALRCAHVFVSRDRGESWERRGNISVPRDEWSFYEPMPVELRNGDIALYLRTAQGISRSKSSDGGWSWSQPVPENYPHPPSRFFVRRLQSGRLLMVRHDSYHTPPRRENLTAFLSEDDGESWHGGLSLDERYGVSYPDGFQDEHGLIRIVYDHLREDGALLMAAFREEDVLARKPVTPECRLKQFIHRLPGYREENDPKKIHVKLMANQ